MIFWSNEYDYLISITLIFLSLFSPVYLYVYTLNVELITRIFTVFIRDFYSYYILQRMVKIHNQMIMMYSNITKIINIATLFYNLRWTVNIYRLSMGGCVETWQQYTPESWTFASANANFQFSPARSTLYLNRNSKILLNGFKKEY